MSQGYPLTKLFASTEKKESPLCEGQKENMGMFATSPIKQLGEYSILPNDPQVMGMMDKAGYFNSAMMPNWKELLPSILRTADDEDDENEDTNKEDVDFTEQLKSFKEGFDIYIKEERAKANVSQSMSLERAKSGGRGVDFAVKVLREIEEGEELLRDYGKEWLAIKYFNLKLNTLHYIEKSQEEENEGKLILSIDTKLLNSSVWEFKKKVIDDDEDTNYELGQYLSMREGKEMIVVSPEELNSLTNIIGMCAIQYLLDIDDETEDDGGNFSDTWKHNLDHLRSHFPRDIVNPSSCSSFETERKKKSAKRSKKQKTKASEGKVLKLKHGEFDVFKMKG